MMNTPKQTSIAEMISVSRELLETDREILCAEVREAESIVLAIVEADFTFFACRANAGVPSNEALTHILL